MLPDAVIRYGIRRLLRKRLMHECSHDSEAYMRRKKAFIDSMRHSPLAIHTDAANEQHYEVPSAFYEAVLGHRLKYSSCLWENGTRDLDSAESDMLALTIDRAGIEDGMDVLELGCGWGSMSLYLASRFPRCRVTAVSNSRSQKAYIDSRAAQGNLSNVQVITADMNTFAPPGSYDRIVSIEMFEHMRNYELLLGRVAGWLKSDGRLFVHIFVHDVLAYPFETDGDDDWMAKYFFTGGMMPSFDIFDHFTSDMVVLEKWKVNGRHYEKTLNAWLANMDRQGVMLRPLFESTYGNEWRTWWIYWRVFFMACAELFGYNNGREWYVGHYLLGKV